MRVKKSIVLGFLLLIVGCASTQITDSWVEPELNRSYQRPMIIGISDSQQTRRIYENQVVAEFKKRNVAATASYTLINSKEELNQETVEKAVQGTEIDSVLVTYLISTETEMRFQDSPISSGYSGDIDDNRVSSTIITSPGRYNTDEIIGLKNDLYDVQSKSIIFSVQTRTVAAESIDQIISDVSALVVDSLFDHELFK